MLKYALKDDIKISKNEPRMDVVNILIVLMLERGSNNILCFFLSMEKQVEKGVEEFNYCPWDGQQNPFVSMCFHAYNPFYDYGHVV